MEPDGCKVSLLEDGRCCRVDVPACDVDGDGISFYVASAGGGMATDDRHAAYLIHAHTECEPGEIMPPGVRKNLEMAAAKYKVAVTDSGELVAYGTGGDSLRDVAGNMRSCLEYVASEEGFAAITSAADPNPA